MGSWCACWFYLIWPVPVAGLGRPVNREEDEALNIGQSEWQSFETSFEDHLVRVCCRSCSYRTLSCSRSGGQTRAFCLNDDVFISSSSQEFEDTTVAGGEVEEGGGEEEAAEPES